MKPVSLKPVVLAGVVITLLTAIVMRLVRNTGASLPQHSWWEVLIVALAAGALLAAGWRVRQYVRALKDDAARRRQGSQPGGASAASAAAASTIDAPGSGFARGTLVFSQAAAMGGAALMGWYLGQAAVHASRWSVPSGRAATIVLLVLTVCALALSAAGFRVQKWCTLPEDQR